MNWPRVLLVCLLLLVYLRSPIDLLPDRMGAIGLIDDLLVLGGVIWWLRRRFDPGPSAGREEVRTQTNDRWDPHAVLGIAPGASPIEITHAYREQMKRYHPDRVADLGEELQRVAHQKTVEIQRAYAELGKR